MRNFIPNFHQGRFSGPAQIDGQDVVEKPVAEVQRRWSAAMPSARPARFTVYEISRAGKCGPAARGIVERISGL